MADRNYLRTADGPDISATAHRCQKMNMGAAESGGMRPGKFFDAVRFGQSHRQRRTGRLATVFGPGIHLCQYLETALKELLIACD